MPLGAVTAVTGVAGAGKSSLAFEVLHAEGYRRYVETFGPYARQFLERFDRPRVEHIEGALPSIAIDRTTPIRTSRSTVGTATAVADYMRALYARASTLFCRRCGEPVERQTAASIFAALLRTGGGRPTLICFPLMTGRVSGASLRDLLQRFGFRRALERGRPVLIEEARLRPEKGTVKIVLDRITIASGHRARIIDSLEGALRWGKGHVELWVEGAAEPLRFSEFLRCKRCGIDYADPTPALFSFNNPIGACATCKGFGRTMDIDPALVVPDEGLSVAEGCVKPFQTLFYSQSQEDLLRFLERRRLSPTTPWRELDDKRRARRTRTMADALVRDPRVLQLSTIEELPHARAGLPLALPALSSLPRLPRCAAQARCSAASFPWQRVVRRAQRRSRMARSATPLSR